MTKKKPESAIAYLGLGSNMGDRTVQIDAAMAALSAHPLIQFDRSQDAASRYETEPVGGPPKQELFINTAVRVSTTLSPHELLSACQDIELKLGRIRSERWGPRVIDIDLLLYDDIVFDDDVLTLPHPRMHERRFVLDPLAEIAGDVIHPALLQPIHAL